MVDIGQVITFYNNAAADLPDPARLKGKQLPGMSTVLDGKGDHYADVFQPGNRRVWVPLGDVPDFVQKAFIAAEDRRFYQHHGIDEHGIIRAFIGNLAESGRPQGGSTITQQVVKNLLVGDDVSYERKIREMIVASRLESTVSKNDILELYINSVYLGRGSWGIEMAARSYFGKSAKDLTLPEGAMLAGLLKGPSFYNPDRHPDRAKERLIYVLGRMQEDGVISAEQKSTATAALPKRVVYAFPHRDSGFNFVDYLGREAKTDGVDSLTAQTYTVRSTINAQLQRDAESALQEGLAQYEMSSGRVQFRGPEANIADAIRKIGSSPAGMPPWQQALQAVRLPLYDVHWTPAVIVQKGDGKKDDGNIRVGLPDGRIMALTGLSYVSRRGLGLYDVVYVNVVESRRAEVRAPAVDARGNPVKPKPQAKPQVTVSSGQAQLRARPTVQGAALVLENKTGRILAMAGSFSYPLSQLNRTWQTQRQPGSAIKPITYLTALQKGLQPNTLVPNDPLTLPPIGSATYGSIIRDSGAPDRPEDYWSPRNADYASGGVFTMRRGLENSINVVTAHLLAGGIDADPVASLDEVCATAKAAKIYTDCVRYYPFVLGAQPVHMIDLAAFYAAVANEGARPQPHAIDAHRGQRQSDLRISQGAAVLADQRRRRGQLLSAQDHAAGRGGARHRARHRRPVALCGRQDRHHRGRGRRLVRRLHQRCDDRGLGRLRQRRRQAPLARLQRDRRAGGAADLQAHSRGHMGRAYRAQGAARRPVARGAAAPYRRADRLRQRRSFECPRGEQQFRPRRSVRRLRRQCPAGRAASRRRQFHRAFPPRRRRASRRYPVSDRLARGRLRRAHRPERRPRFVL